MPTKMTEILQSIETTMAQDDLLDVLYSTCLTLGDNAGQKSKQEYSIADLRILSGWIAGCVQAMTPTDVMRPVLNSQIEYIQGLINHLTALTAEDNSKDHTTPLGLNFYELEKLIFSLHHLYSPVPSSMLEMLGLDLHADIDFFSAFDQALLIDSTQLIQEESVVSERKRAYLTNFACHDANKVLPGVLATLAINNRLENGTTLRDQLQIDSVASLSPLSKEAINKLSELFSDADIQQTISAYNETPSMDIALELNQEIGQHINHDELSLALYSINSITGIFTTDPQYQSLSHILSSRDMWSSVESIDVFLFLQGMLSKETLEMQRHSFSELTAIQTRQVLMFTLADALGQTVSTRRPDFLTIRIQKVFQHLESMTHRGETFDALPATLTSPDFAIDSTIELQLRRMEGALRWVTNDNEFGLCLGIQQKLIWCDIIRQYADFLTDLNTLFSTSQNMDYLPEVALNLLMQLPEYAGLSNHNAVSQQPTYIATCQSIVPNLVKALALYTREHSEDDVINFTALKTDLLAEAGSKKRGAEESVESINDKLRIHIQSMMAKQGAVTGSQAGFFPSRSSAMDGDGAAAEQRQAEETLRKG